jgi:hypothetical protein
MNVGFHLIRAIILWLEAWMAYTDKTKFVSDYGEAHEAAMKMNVPDSVPVSPERAFEFYRASFALKTTQVNANGESVPPLQIFGRLFLDDTANRMSVRELREMPGITLYEWQNFNSLKLNDWNMAINDTWLLSGVNSLQPFYPASLVNKENIIDARFTPPLTIMGREFAGLALAGYREASIHPILGKAYAHTPGNEKKAQDLGFRDYAKGLSQLKTVADVEKFFSAAGFTID